MATVEELADVPQDSDDPMGVFFHQIGVIVASYMKDSGCCETCIESVGEAFVKVREQ